MLQPVEVKLISKNSNLAIIQFNSRKYIVEFSWLLHKDRDIYYADLFDLIRERIYNG